MNTKIIKLDINKKLYQRIAAKQRDVKSRYLFFHLLDVAIPFNLTNRSVRVYAIKPDGTEIFNDLQIVDAAKGICKLELTTQILAVEGIVIMEIMVTEGLSKLTSNIFELEVGKSINSETAIVSTNEFTALVNGLASLSEYDSYKNELKLSRGSAVSVPARLDGIDSQMADIENKQSFLNQLKLKFIYGAIGDGTEHLLSSKFQTLEQAKLKYKCADSLTNTIDWCAIQEYYNDCKVGEKVYIPQGKYVTNKSLNFNKENVDIQGEQKVTEIKNIGVGSTMLFTKPNFTLKNIALDGNGRFELDVNNVNKYGVGSNIDYGIELSGMNGGVGNFKLENVISKNNKRHGVYCHGGVWIGTLNDCEFILNGESGCNCFYNNNEQNGNHLTVNGGSFSSNGVNGILVGALSVLLNNINCENNNEVGLKVKGQFSNIQINSGYFERNHKNQILFDTSLGIVNATLKNCYLNDLWNGFGAENILIKAEGTNKVVVNIDECNYSGFSNTVYVDLNNLADYGSTLKHVKSYGALKVKFKNLGRTRINTSPRTLMLVGKFLSKGNIQFTSAYNSDNFISLPNKSVEFYLQLDEGNVITNYFFNLVNNSTKPLTTKVEFIQITRDGSDIHTEFTHTTVGAEPISKDLTSPIMVNNLEGLIMKLTFSITEPDGSALLTYNPILTIA